MIRLEINANTDEPTAEWCKKYWELDELLNFVYTAKELSELAEMSTSRFASFVSNNSKAYATNQKCIDCGVEPQLKNRAAFKRIWNQYQKGWKCGVCMRKDALARELSGEAARERTRERIRQHFDLSTRKPILVSNLDLEDAVGLLAVIRVGASEDLGVVLPFGQSQVPLGPTEELKDEIVTGIYQKHLLFIHPDSPPESINFTEDAVRFFPRKVSWALPIGPGGETFEVLEELERIVRERDFPSHWAGQIDALWTKIALHECLEYLNLCLNKHNLEANPGPKTHLAFSSILHDYSVAQMYSFIWRAAKEAAAFYMRERVTKQHAANTVLGTIQRSADNAKAGGWDVKPFRRDFDCPQSMISRVFFGSLLQIGDGGFTIPLSLRPGLLADEPHTTP